MPVTMEIDPTYKDYFESSERLKAGGRSEEDVAIRNILGSEFDEENLAWDKQNIEYEKKLGHKGSLSGLRHQRSRRWAEDIDAIMSNVKPSSSGDLQRIAGEKMQRLFDVVPKGKHEELNTMLSEGKNLQGGPFSEDAAHEMSLRKNRIVSLLEENLMIPELTIPKKESTTEDKIMNGFLQQDNKYKMGK